MEDEKDYLMKPNTGELYRKIVKFNEKIETYNNKLKEFMEIHNKVDYYDEKYGSYKSKLDELTDSYDEIIEEMKTVWNFSLDDINKSLKDVDGNLSVDVDWHYIEEISKEEIYNRLNAFKNSNENEAIKYNESNVKEIFSNFDSTDDLIKDEYYFEDGTYDKIKIKRTDSNILSVNFGILYTQLNMSHFNSIKNIDFERDNSVINRYYRGVIFFTDCKTSPKMKCFMIIPDTETLFNYKSVGPIFDIDCHYDSSYIYISFNKLVPFRLDWKDIGDDVEIFDMYDKEHISNSKIKISVKTYFYEDGDSAISYDKGTSKETLTKIIDSDIEIRPLESGFYKYKNFKPYNKDINIITKDSDKDSYFSNVISNNIENGIYNKYQKESIFDFLNYIDRTYGRNAYLTENFKFNDLLVKDDDIYLATTMGILKKDHETKEITNLCREWFGSHDCLFITENSDGNLVTYTKETGIVIGNSNSFERTKIPEYNTLLDIFSDIIYVKYYKEKYIIVTKNEVYLYKDKDTYELLAEIHEQEMSSSSPVSRFKLLLDIKKKDYLLYIGNKFVVSINLTDFDDDKFMMKVIDIEKLTGSESVNVKNVIINKDNSLNIVYTLNGETAYYYSNIDKSNGLLLDESGAIPTHTDRINDSTSDRNSTGFEEIVKAEDGNDSYGIISNGDLKVCNIDIPESEFNKCKQIHFSYKFSEFSFENEITTSNDVIKKCFVTVNITTKSDKVISKKYPYVKFGYENINIFTFEDIKSVNIAITINGQVINSLCHFYMSALTICNEFNYNPTITSGLVTSERSKDFNIFNVNDEKIKFISIESNVLSFYDKDMNVIKTIVPSVISEDFYSKYKNLTENVKTSDLFINMSTSDVINPKNAFIINDGSIYSPVKYNNTKVKSLDAIKEEISTKLSKEFENRKRINNKDIPVPYKIQILAKRDEPNRHENSFDSVYNEVGIFNGNDFKSESTEYKFFKTPMGLVAVNKEDNTKVYISNSDRIKLGEVYPDGSIENSRFIKLNVPNGFVRATDRAYQSKNTYLLFYGNDENLYAYGNNHKKLIAHDEDEAVFYTTPKLINLPVGVKPDLVYSSNDEILICKGNDRYIRNNSNEWEKSTGSRSEIEQSICLFGDEKDVPDLIYQKGSSTLYSIQISEKNFTYEILNGKIKFNNFYRENDNFVNGPESESFEKGLSDNHEIKTIISRTRDSILVEDENGDYWIIGNVDGFCTTMTFTPDFIKVSKDVKLMNIKADSVYFNNYRTFIVSGNNMYVSSEVSKGLIDGLETYATFGTGMKHTTSPIIYFTKIPNLPFDPENVEKMILNDCTTYVLLKNGKLYASGNNIYGELNDFKVEVYDEFTLIEENVDDMWGKYNKLFIAKLFESIDGTSQLIYAIGYNKNGELGYTDPESLDIYLSKFTLINAISNKLVSESGVSELKNDFIKNIYVYGKCSIALTSSGLAFVSGLISDNSETYSTFRTLTDKKDFISVISCLEENGFILIDRFFNAYALGDNKNNRFGIGIDTRNSICDLGLKEKFNNEDPNIDIKTGVVTSDNIILFCKGRIEKKNFVIRTDEGEFKISETDIIPSKCIENEHSESITCIDNNFVLFDYFYKSNSYIKLMENIVDFIITDDYSFIKVYDTTFRVGAIKLKNNEKEFNYGIGCPYNNNCIYKRVDTFDEFVTYIEAYMGTPTNGDNVNIVVSKSNIIDIVQKKTIKLRDFLDNKSDIFGVERIRNITNLMHGLDEYLNKDGIIYSVNFEMYPFSPEIINTDVEVSDKNNSSTLQIYGKMR